MATELTTDVYADQIDAYTAEKPHFDIWAEVLARVLRHACAVAFPEAIVQARAKSVASFAEKCARRWDKYGPSPVTSMTDLCGARVILQTLEQVEAVKAFVHRSFAVIEADDKSLSLGEDTFGYRDMHFIVKLDPEKSGELPLEPEERAAIGPRPAEIQVRTCLQHAWADTLHDRLYKNSLQLSPEVKRTCGVLAALMEEGDNVFNGVAGKVDGLIANYTAYAPKADVEDEIKVQELILAHNTSPDKQAALSLRLAQLLAACNEHGRVVTILSPHRDICGPLLPPLRLCLGTSLCCLNRANPNGAAYRQGVADLETARDKALAQDRAHAHNLRQQESLRAKVLNRLGWALEIVSGRSGDARSAYRQAREHEPENPYYLSDMLEFESRVADSVQLRGVLRTTLVEAVKTCRAHGEAGIQLPHAYFTAGRLSLMIGGDAAAEALGYYARGIHYCASDLYCVPATIIRREIELLERDCYGGDVPPQFRSAMELLRLGQYIWDCRRAERDPEVEPPPPLPAPDRPLTGPVLIVSGGAASLDTDTREKIRPLLAEGLAVIRGTVTSGGTTAGIPGLVGDLTDDLEADGKLAYELVGYRPAELPRGDDPHPAYKATVELGDGYSPGQMVRNWQDIMRSGIDPADVLLLGFGGGPISAVEYRIALGLGADVAVVMGTGGAADQLPQDKLWQLPNLYPMPLDAATFRAFLVKAPDRFEPPVLDRLGQQFHERYVAGSQGRLPENMRPWPGPDQRGKKGYLTNTYVQANIEQARYAIEILAAAGFGVRKVDNPTVFDDFSDSDIQRMAELEHGRWNVERLRAGWRYAPERDDERKLHNSILPWTDKRLDDVRQYDEDAMRTIPRILAPLGLEVYRKDDH